MTADAGGAGAGGGTGAAGAGPAGGLAGLTARFDRWVERPFVQLRGNPLADRIFYGASEAANFSVLWHGLAWLPVLVSPTAHRLIRAASTSAALAIESAIVNGPVKSAFRRTRPVLLQHEIRPLRLRQPKTTSFPSGHASAAAVAVAMMGRGRNPLSRAALLAVASVVASSRVYVRIHHPSDVIGGAAIGWALGRTLRTLLPGR
jgi:undecaprenyl-diphosphatase